MKILYLMHVDWNWIKQRPHFIAEGLAKNNNEVEVYYIGRKKEVLVKNETSILAKPVFRLRGLWNPIISKINQIVYFFVVKKIMFKNKFDYIYVTHPSLYSKALKGCIIYDCMDDYTAFSMPNFKRKEIASQEKKLLQKSSIVLFSSKYLSECVIKRYGITPFTYEIVNNAIELPDITLQNKLKARNENKLILTYIGTVANWFDFELLKIVKKEYSKKNIEFDIYGPCDIMKESEGFNFKGPIEHDEIFNVMNHSDILIMPFIVNDLIKSVNPVKLYEYIYSCKPIICVRYGETEKFEKFVYLYDNERAESFMEQIDLILANNMVSKASDSDSIQFVKDNTWDNRIKQLIGLLQK